MDLDECCMNSVDGCCGFFSVVVGIGLITTIDIFSTFLLSQSLRNDGWDLEDLSNTDVIESMAIGSAIGVCFATLTGVCCVASRNSSSEFAMFASILTINALTGSCMALLGASILQVASSSNELGFLALSGGLGTFISSIVTVFILFCVSNVEVSLSNLRPSSSLLESSQSCFEMILSRERSSSTITTVPKTSEQVELGDEDEVKHKNIERPSPLNI